MTGWQTIKRSKIIADIKWIHYAYFWPFLNVNPKNQKEVNYENLSSGKNLDRLSRGKLEKKILCVLTGGSLKNFALITEEKS